MRQMKFTEVAPLGIVRFTLFESAAQLAVVWPTKTEPAALPVTVRGVAMVAGVVAPASLTSMTEPRKQKLVVPLYGPEN